MPTKNPLLVLLVVINTIGAIFLFLNQQSLDKEIIEAANFETSSDIENKDIEITIPLKEGYLHSELKLPPIAANLAAPSGPQRYLKINMALFIETPANAKNLEVTTRMPLIRDEVVRYINSKTEEEVLKFSGKEVIKNHIKDFANENLKNDQIIDIYFVKFEIK